MLETHEVRCTIGELVAGILGGAFATWHERNPLRLDW